MPIEHLINGASILWDNRQRVVDYYHVEVDGHDIPLANGAPSETILDDDSRHLFQNEHGPPDCRAAAPAGPQ